MNTTTLAPPRVGLVTLGCDKNTVDNEYLAAMLENHGLEVILREDGLPLDAAIVTTCGFIASAREQSLETIRELARRKAEFGSPARLYVAGCLSQKMGADMITEIPGIDGMVGVGQFDTITKMLLADREEGGGAHGPSVDVAPSPTVDIYQHLTRRPVENRAHAFLKISDGCNHGCTFCSIPSMKGALRSVEPEILLAEARALLDRGVREIALVAQDLSDYGRDRWKDYRLPELLRDLAALPGDFWIRCMYYYPGNVTDRFLGVLAEGGKILPYLEMPLQHLDPVVLRAMKRPFHDRNTFETVERIRAAVPGITLRTTVIVGFPGETNAAFNNLLKGLKRIRFDRLGSFEYSHEPGTPSGAMPEQVAEKTKAWRWRMVMDQQAKISRALTRKRLGERTRVLIEAYDPEFNRYTGRSPAEAPGVDGKVLVTSDRPLTVGDFTDVQIVDCDTYDVLAQA